VRNGECPKNRFVEGDGETGPNYLRDGYRALFAHAEPAMQVMAVLGKERHGPAGTTCVSAAAG